MLSQNRVQAVLNRMDNDGLLMCWEAICGGGLGGATEVNGYSVDEWVEAVYSEINYRLI